MFDLPDDSFVPELSVSFNVRRMNSLAQPESRAPDFHLCRAIQFGRNLRG